MAFLAGIVPPPDVHSIRDGAFLAFRDGAILLTNDGAFLHDARIFGDRVADARFVGTLDGRACFAIAIERTDLRDRGVPASAPIFEPPAGASFGPLRGSLGMLDDDRLVLVSTASQIATWDDTHRICGRCATPLVAKTTERAKVCDTCKLHFYPRIAPAVIVLVHDGKRALLTHKNPMPFHALVAGFVEAGETFEEAVAREVREETGVEVDELRYMGSQPWPFPHQIMIGFYARYAGGDVVVDHNELDDAAWFDESAMPPLPPRLSIARKMIDAWLADVRR